MRFHPEKISHPVRVAQAAGRTPSVFAFSMAKAGSTLLYNILERLAPAAGLTYFSVEDTLFNSDVSPQRRPCLVGQPFHAAGYCYGGFRQFPIYRVGHVDTARTILLVRDPRDMIVSLYFSLRYSHALPENKGESGAGAAMAATRAKLNKTEIDKFALEAVKTYAKAYEGYLARGFAWMPNVAIYRYEDVVMSKTDWVDDICNWYGWDVAEDGRRRVAAEFDVLPDAERPDAHVRQVRPGNHKEHLSTGVEQNIVKSLGEYMRMFGYL